MGRLYVQFRALVRRRFTVAKRDKKFALVGLVFPLLGAILVIIISRLVDKNLLDVASSSIKDSPQSIPYVAPSAASSATPLLKALSSAGNMPIAFTSYGSLNAALANCTSAPCLHGLPGAYVLQHVDNATGSFVVTIAYNDTADNALPLMTQKLFRAICIRAVILLLIYSIHQTDHTTLAGHDVKIIETNAPLPPLLNTDAIFLYYGPFIIEYFSIFILPYYAVQLVSEKDKKLKQQLLLNSVDLRMYWLSTFVCDFVLYMVPALLSIVLLYAFGIHAISNNNVLAPLLVFAVFGCAGLPLAYLLSFVFQKEETANKFLYSVVSLVTLIPYLVITVALQNQAPASVRYALSVIPSYALLQGLDVLAQSGISSGGLTAPQIFSTSHGLFPILLIELTAALVLSALVLMIDLEIFQKLKRRKEYKRVMVCDEDADVAAERARVCTVLASSMICVSELQKEFPPPSGSSSKQPKIAVGNVSFGVTVGECFGLLGPNGAGKTTLLSMLTGTIVPDLGNAYINGSSILTHKNEAFRSIGVCPQFDILWDLMTGREHLRLYARIKLIPEQDVEAEVENLLRKFGLVPWADALSSAYSGGNKRKLSAALSLIGDPRVIFMDEPSTGMDPVTRRMMWEVINTMKQERAIILTTHSMDEADALCTKIGIVVKGNMRCIGTSQHLKDKFGNGYRLTISAPSCNREHIENWVERVYPQARKQEEIGQMINYIIPQQVISLPHVFKWLEENKAVYGIVDYCVSQTSLEQVFLRFALEQDEADSAHLNDI